jgi:hypothetical protein
MNIENYLSSRPSLHHAGDEITTDKGLSRNFYSCHCNRIYTVDLKNHLKSQPSKICLLLRKGAGAFLYPSTSHTSVAQVNFVLGIFHRVVLNIPHKQRNLPSVS